MCLNRFGVLLQVCGHAGSYKTSGAFNEGGSEWVSEWFGLGAVEGGTNSYLMIWEPNGRKCIMIWWTVLISCFLNRITISNTVLLRLLCDASSSDGDVAAYMVRNGEVRIIIENANLSYIKYFTISKIELTAVRLPVRLSCYNIKQKQADKLATKETVNSTDSVLHCTGCPVMLLK